MSEHDTTIDTLAARLSGDDPTPLAPEERALIVGSLRQLAADQALIVRLRRLLALQDESDRRLGAIAGEAIGSIRRRMGDPPADIAYDYKAAEAARTRLTDAIESARTGRDTLRAILTFARDVTVLAR